uniref:Uncharacterized protein n=1 Tax=Suricata suricatta TaxID=37032 RepID=A0A673V563_SURSU
FYFIFWRKNALKNSLKYDCHLFSTKNFLRLFKTRFTNLSFHRCSPSPGVFKMKEKTTLPLDCSFVWGDGGAEKERDREREKDSLIHLCSVF